MILHLLLAAPFFTAGLVTLLPHLVADAARELTVGLLTTTVLAGAIAYQVLARLDQPATAPTSPETRP